MSPVCYLRDLLSCCSPVNLLFLNLAVSDLLTALFGTCLEFAWTVMRKRHEPNTLACDLFGFFTFFGGKTAGTALPCIRSVRGPNN